MSMSLSSTLGKSGSPQYKILRPRRYSGHNRSLDAFGSTPLLPLSARTTSWTIFAQHAFSDDFVGSANSLGSTVTIPGVTNFLDLELQYEARFVDNQFIPGLFNSNYELQPTPYRHP